MTRRGTHAYSYSSAACDAGPRAPVISMLLESVSKPWLEDSAPDRLAGSDDEEPVQIHLVDLPPSETVFCSLQSGAQSWSVAESSCMSATDQDSGPVCFERPPGSAEKTYAKLYFRIIELVNSGTDLLKWLYSKVYQYYWYVLINVSVRYPRFGTWL